MTEYKPLFDPKMFELVEKMKYHLTEAAAINEELKKFGIDFDCAVKL